jgi:hypothetical protein
VIWYAFSADSRNQVNRKDFWTTRWFSRAPNGSPPIVAQISYSSVNEMHKGNHENILMIMRNQSNSKVFWIIRRKYPGISIGAHQKVSIHGSMNRPFTGLLANALQRQNMHILSDLNCPITRPGRAKVPSVQFTDRPSKSNTVKWNHQLQLRQPFPMKNFY